MSTHLSTSSTLEVAAGTKIFRYGLWLIFGAGALVGLPQCLDHFLAPRFCFLSLAFALVLLIGSTSWVFHDKFRLLLPDLLLLGWYGWNLASMAWAYSAPEAFFYSQKVLLFLSAYFLIRMALLSDQVATVRTMRQIALFLTIVTIAVLSFQLTRAISSGGLDNQHLYAYASGLSGNKGLASDFLFLLFWWLILLPSDKRGIHAWWAPALLALFILLLQTRTVYLAMVLSGLVYAAVRASRDTGYRSFLLRRLLPPALLGAGLLAAFVFFQKGHSLAERLNPLTYLESASANERRFVWYKTDQLNRDHVWLGVGNGSWKLYFPSKGIQGAFRLQEKGIVFNRAHNDFLEIRAELGIIGAAWYLLLFAAIGLALLWRVHPERTAQAAALIALLTGYCVLQYFDFPRERPEFQVLLGAFFAWSVHLAREKWSRLYERAPGRTGRIALLAIAVAGNIGGFVFGLYRISGEMHNLRMLRAQTAGRLDEALREAQAADNPCYRLDNVVIPLKWYEGNIYMHRKETAKAAQAFAEAYRLNPWNTQVLNNYGTALSMNGAVKESIPYFEQAVAINTSFDQPKLNLAYVWLQLGDTDQALAWMGKIDTIPGPKTPEDFAQNRAVWKKREQCRATIEAKIQAEAPH